jgi:ABC-2 type transport system permease protein
MSLFLLQFGGEVKKLFARKRTYLGFGAFLGMEIALISLLHIPRVHKFILHMLSANGYADAEHYYSGLTLAFIVLAWSIMLLGSLYLALVSGDIVSKEIEDGTMRMMLCRPISRFRLLLVKYLACLLYAAVLILYICATALIVGLLYRGPGGLFVFVPEQSVFAVYEFREGLGRYLTAIPFICLSVFTISSLGFLFSCLRMKPSAATILTLSVLFVDFVLSHMPFLEAINYYFVTYRMSHWVQLFKYEFSWAGVVENYVILLACQLTFFVLAWLAVEFRDFKN